ncbi:MAG: DUF4097 family beta strand repeat protein, partial [Spirochaetales bacterium]|nr:DUF4097 family beta strand repeat protein [Spirochaetales bacterium]
TGSFSYRSSDVRKIAVSYVSGDLRVVQSDSRTLNATESGKNISEDQAMRWYIDGDTLRIQFCKSGYSGNMPSKTLDLEIPYGVELEIGMTSGDVTFVTDVTAGDVNLGSTSGGKHIKTLVCADFKEGSTSGSTSIDFLHAVEAEFGSSSGNTSIGTLETDDAEFAATSGNLEISSVRCAKVDIGATSGNITLGFDKCDKLKIGCTSGDVTLTRLPSGGASIEFDKTSGNLRADGYMVKGGRMVYGDGACRMDINTTSGDLTIK